MFKNFLISTILLTTLLANNLSADDIYVVDVQRVINESTKGKAAREIVEATAKKEQEKLDQIKNSLKKMQDELQKQSSILSGEALAEKQQQYIKKEKELAGIFEEQKKSFDQKNRTEIGKVVEQIDKVIKKLVAENDYKFVVEKDPRVVVYTVSDYDITDKVIENLDN